MIHAGCIRLVTSDFSTACGKGTLQIFINVPWGTPALPSAQKLMYRTTESGRCRTAWGLTTMRCPPFLLLLHAEHGSHHIDNWTFVVHTTTQFATTVCILQYSTRQSKRKVGRASLHLTCFSKLYCWEAQETFSPVSRTRIRFVSALISVPWLRRRQSEKSQENCCCCS